MAYELIQPQNLTEEEKKKKAQDVGGLLQNNPVRGAPTQTLTAGKPQQDVVSYLNAQRQPTSPRKPDVIVDDKMEGAPVNRGALNPKPPNGIEYQGKQYFSGMATPEGTGFVPDLDSEIKNPYAKKPDVIVDDKMEGAPVNRGALKSIPNPSDPGFRETTVDFGDRSTWWLHNINNPGYQPIPTNPPTLGKRPPLPGGIDILPQPGIGGFPPKPPILPIPPKPTNPGIRPPHQPPNIWGGPLDPKEAERQREKIDKEELATYTNKENNPWTGRAWEAGDSYHRDPTLDPNSKEGKKIDKFIKYLKGLGVNIYEDGYHTPHFSSQDSEEKKKALNSLVASSFF